MEKLKKDKGRVEVRASLSHIELAGFLRQTSVLTVVRSLELFSGATIKRKIGV